MFYYNQFKIFRKTFCEKVDKLFFSRANPRGTRFLQFFFNEVLNFFSWKKTRKSLCDINLCYAVPIYEKEIKLKLFKKTRVFVSY